uniref:Candidate secreted effector n=1 Tax=Meloidogyne incognita TaxID=6306 RepID=A0A914L1N1_MELIC
MKLIISPSTPFKSFLFNPNECHVGSFHHIFCYVFHTSITGHEFNINTKQQKRRK